jgi:hypothetical protein
VRGRGVDRKAGRRNFILGSWHTTLIAGGVARRGLDVVKSAVSALAVEGRQAVQLGGNLWSRSV